MSNVRCVARNEVGLPALYAALHDTLTRHSLAGLALTVHDPDLGVQHFAGGPEAVAALEECGDDVGAWAAVPPLDAAPPELALLRALARTAVRLGAADRDADPATGLEVTIRRVPGVRTVLTEGSVVRVVTSDDARDEVIAGLAALDLGSASGLSAVVVVESLLGVPDTSAAPVSAPSARVELVAVLSQPETGELEVHLRFGEHRTVGRGPLARAGTAAAEATLAALEEFGTELGYRIAWARTVDSLPNREFLVGVAITRPDATPLYGLAPGSSPIVAAARATLDACNRNFSA